MMQQFFIELTALLLGFFVKQQKFKKTSIQESSIILTNTFLIE